jgi:pSer/pThr/pTyr-binding forkhead associated (FHA) protein
MASKLQVTSGKSSGRELALEGKAIFEVGTAPSVDLALDDPQVAATHVKVYAANGDFSVFDVSGQGFAHNGNRTLKASLVHGDEIQIGGTRLRLTKAEASPLASVRDAPPAAAASARCELMAVKGNDAGKSYDLQAKPMFVIGRGMATDITVWDIRASRVHCRIDRDEQGFLVTDLNAANGTYVNGVKIESHRLKPGDEIKVGSTVLQYVQQTGGGG